MLLQAPCPDPEWGQGSGPPPPEKSQKYDPPEKSQSYQASIQCWAIIGKPAKRHLNAVLLVD